MVIRRMNSFFHRHGRIFFGGITIVIIVSFVGFLTPGFTGMFNSMSSSNSAGTSFGGKVSDDEMASQVSNSMIAMSLQYGIDLRTPSMREMAIAGAFDTICLRRAAYNLGIRISNREVAEFIKNLPIFKGENGFDVAKYELYVKNILTPSGFNKQELDEAVRQNLMVDSLFRQISSEVIITPDELKNFFNAVQEKFDVKVARFLADDCKKQIKLSDDELKTYFEANRENYMMPARFKVEVVRFNYIDYENEAKTKINDDLVKKYYEANKKEFVSKETKQPMPFEEAAKKIKADLLNEAEKELAVRDAQLFAVDAYNKVEDGDEKNKTLAFEDLAKERKLSVFKTDWFSTEDHKIEGIGREPELIKAVAATYDKLPVSDAIAGKRAAFVAFLTDRQEPRQAEFSEIKAKVENNLKQHKSLALAREKSRQIALKISEAKDKSQVFESLKNEIKFDKIDTFVTMMPPYGPDGAVIAKLAEDTAAGKVSSVQDTENGAIVVFVEKRTLPKDEDLEKQKSMIESVYRQKKIQAAVENFSLWVKTNSLENDTRQKRRK